MTAEVWKRRKEAIPPALWKPEKTKRPREKLTSEHFLHKLTSLPHPCTQGLVSLTRPSGMGCCTYSDKHKE